MQEANNIYQKINPETLGTVERFKKNLLKAEDREVSDDDYQKLFEKYEPLFMEALEKIINLWKSPEHQQTLGHDTIHISYDILEYLHLTDGSSLNKSEKYLVLFGSLLHDLGRYPELLMADRSEAMDFNKPRQTQVHAMLSSYIGLHLAKDLRIDNEDDPDIKKASLAFNRRVIGAALYHGGKNVTEDPVIHHVQSIDRLADILGSREFVRNITTDGVQRGAAIYPDERLDYSKSMPAFSNLPRENFSNSPDPKNSWTNVFHYIEMPLRNMFPLSSQIGTERSKKMKREAGIILTLMSGGPGSTLYKQTFAPELDSDAQATFPKTALPLEIWQAINKGLNEEEKQEMTGYNPSQADLVDAMLDQQAPLIVEQDRKKVHDLIASVPADRQVDIYNTIKYVVIRHKLNKEIEQEFLSSKKDSSDPLISYLAKDLLTSPLFKEK